MDRAGLSGSCAGHGAYRAASSAPLLSVRDLSVSFNDGERWLRRSQNVSFDVNPGETVGIVGESGCGKSLTALSLMALLPKRGCRRTGQIMFEGRRPRRRSTRPPCARFVAGASAWCFRSR